MPVTAPFCADIVDFGAMGLGIQTSDYLEVGGPYTLKISSKSKHLRVPGAIRWCRLVGTRPRLGGDHEPSYRAGLFILDSPMVEGWRRAR